MKKIQATLKTKLEKSTWTASWYKATLAVKKESLKSGMTSIQFVVRGYDSMPKGVCKQMAKMLGWEIVK